MAKDEELVKTEDFLAYCRWKDYRPEDPITLHLFKNDVIDHGGNLDDCT